MEDRLDVKIREKFDFSRDYAKDIILKGSVFVDGKCIKKPAFKISDENEIKILEEALPKYVSRGGYKLEKALNSFNIKLLNKACLDIGASTGGFTDCMLKNGAIKVYAVDVGSSQLHSDILVNKKVTSFENMDIRNFETCEKIDFIAVDVSFISVIKIIKKINEILDTDGEVIILIKPQFEVGKKNVEKNGIVKKSKNHIDAIYEVIKFGKENSIYTKGLTYSPIKGMKGNIEYLLYMNREQCHFEPDVKNIVLEAFDNLK